MSDRAVQDIWVEKFLGLAVAGPVGTASPGNGLAAWQAARKDVIGQLKTLQGKIAAMKHPRGDPASILVRSIQANLTVKPESRRDVDELERYLQSDDTIQEAEMPNGFGIKIEIRKTLLPALATLKGEFAA